MLSFFLWCRQLVVRTDLYIFINLPIYSKFESGISSLLSKSTNNWTVFLGVNHGAVLWALRLVLRTMHRFGNYLVLNHGNNVLSSLKTVVSFVMLPGATALVRVMKPSRLPVQSFFIGCMMCRMVAFAFIKLWSTIRNLLAQWQPVWRIMARM